jgi:hypothetical protein
MSEKVQAIQGSSYVTNIAVGGRVINRNGKRSARRFPLKLRVRYRIQNEGLVSIDQAGKSLDISSNGLFIAPEKPSNLSIGTDLVAVVEWPVLRDSSMPMQLVVSGWVVRFDTRGFAISFRDHAMRTIETGGRQITEDPLATWARKFRRRIARRFARTLATSVTG